MQPTSAYIEAGQHIEIPLGCNDLHHEIELGVVINKTCKRVTAEAAMEYVGGYCLALDMTARDFQVQSAKQCTVGQSPKGMMVFIYIGHYQGCRVLKCVQGCCRVCPGVLQNVCRDTECVQGAVLTSSLAQQD